MREILFPLLFLIAFKLSSETLSKDQQRDPTVVLFSPFIWPFFQNTFFFFFQNLNFLFCTGISIPHGSAGKEPDCQCRKCGRSPETWVWFLNWEDSLEKEIATRSSILAWKSSMDRGAWQVTALGVTHAHTQRINSVVVVSGEQPYMYMYPFSPKPLSRPGWQVTLNRVPCAIQ